MGEEEAEELLTFLFGRDVTLKPPEEGLRVLAEAVDVVRTIGERFYEAELYRLKGELLLAQVLPAQEGKKQKPVLSL